MTWLWRAPAAVLFFATVLAVVPEGGRAGATMSTPPLPKLARFIPASAHVTSEHRVALTNRGPKDLVITYDGRRMASSDNAAQDLLVLIWHHATKRWATFFDGAKTGIKGTSNSSNAIFPSTDHIKKLAYKRIVGASRRPALAMWADVSGKTREYLVTAIVEDNPQTKLSPVRWGDEFPLGGSGPRLVGKAPHQLLRVTGGVYTKDDPPCCTVRTFTVTVGIPRRYNVTGFTILATTRSWLAIEAVAVGSGSTAKLIVIQVANGPASGVLRPGDQLLSVAGVSRPRMVEGLR